MSETKTSSRLGRPSAKSLTAMPARDTSIGARGANTALDSVRRERQREHARRRKPKGARRSGKGASWRQDLYRARHRLLKANERLTERERGG